MSEQLIKQFGLMAIESDASKVELLEFVETLRHGKFVGVSMIDISISHIP